MSTKIHNGYKVAVSSLAELSAFNSEAKRRLRLAANELCAQVVARIATETLDKIRLGKLTGVQGFNPLFRHAWCQYRERQLECRKSQMRDVGNDLDFWWRFHILPSGEVFAIIGFEEGLFQEAWRCLPGVVHLPYWNNEDPPTGVSWSEWAEIGIRWDAAIETPALSHKLFEDWNHPDCPAVSSVVAAQPEHAKRVHRFAEEAAFDELAQDIPLEAKSSKSLSWVMALFASMRTEPAAMAVLQKHKERLASILPERWAKADFGSMITEVTPDA